MKLLRVHIISSKTCGGLLDNLNVELRNPFEDDSSFTLFDPLCLIGPNGAGKSQFLQVIAEIFQSIFRVCIGDEERHDGNPDLQFEIEYLIYPEDDLLPVRVRISRKAAGRKRPTLIIQKKDEYDWIDCDLTDEKNHVLLPEKIVGYTSGDNETLSRPFLISRRGYAGAVATASMQPAPEDRRIPDTRLMLIDYGTNFEVLVANLLFGDDTQWGTLLGSANLRYLHSFRCIVQLAHSAAPSNPRKREGGKRPNEVLITPELEEYLENLKRCATCYNYEDKTKTHTFDYWINDRTREAFRYFWNSALNLYSSFHKLAMLNDLVLPKNAREFFQNKSSDFAERPPEPQKEDKVFRFEWVRFINTGAAKKEVGYVSLSDGEHQLIQILSTLCMLSSPNILFLLDEPESHFNPKWRVKFISQILDLLTKDGDRKTTSRAAKQDCLLTTHSPFVPSDMQKEKVFIFTKNAEGRIEINNPDIQTFGATFDRIIGKCFDVNPPLSQRSRDEITELMKSDDPEKIKEGIQHLGDSVEKAFLADRLRQLTNEDGV
jgi:restriction system-associated AAA family ATPase